MGTSESLRKLEVAAEFNQAIVLKLADTGDVHAETAISAAARMAGTLLLKSSGMPLACLKPGTAVFSDAVNDQWQDVLGIVSRTLTQLKVTFDLRKWGDNLAPQHQPRLGLLETQMLLHPSFRDIVRRNGLTDGECVYAAAVAIAWLIQQCAVFLDPALGYAIAVRGIMEGCKTVPMS